MEYLLLLPVQYSPVLEVLRLEFLRFGVQLAHAVDFIADVLEEGVEVLLEVAVLVANYVAPLHHHVVQGYVGVVKDWLSVGW